MDSKSGASPAGQDRSLTLRPVVPGDEAFLYQLYADSREEELAMVDFTDAQREAFLRMQFDAQRAHYEQHYPRAEHSIIVRDGVDAGRLWVERNEKEIRCLDVALLKAHRGSGIGSYVIKGLIEEARQTSRPLHMSVEKNNPAAKRLYERLGLVVVSEIPTHYFMEYDPSGAAAKE